VRDAAAVEAGGVPVVLVHMGGVSNVVTSASRAHRLPDLARIAIVTPFFGRSRAEIAQLASPQLAALVSDLLGAR
jgi:hypothetical protein